MKARRENRPAARLFRQVLVACLCSVFALGALGLYGCASTTDGPASNEQESSGTESLANEEVTGTIASISETELLVEVSESSDDFLQGQVRVDLSQIADSVVQSLQVNDVVKIEFSGQVGMSEPPFISAITLERLG